jgi:hypothetical protein
MDRRYVLGGYRYGFNGQERSTEINREGNSYTAEFWEYDSRIGQRWNVDPVTKPFESSYSVFGGNPISNIDIDGADWFKGKQGDVYWIDSQKKSLKLNGHRFKNIGETITIHTISFINVPNDLPLPNSKWQKAGAGNKLTTYITISPNYDANKRQVGFKVDYNRKLGATFDLSNILDGVNYPQRPNTPNGYFLATYDNERTSKYKTLDFKINAHITTPGIETFGLNYFGRNVDVSQDITIKLIQNRLDVSIAHGSYPSVDMKIIGSAVLGNPNEHIIYYRYQQTSFLASHAQYYYLFNFRRVKEEVKQAEDLYQGLNNSYYKQNKAHYVYPSYIPD